MDAFKYLGLWMDSFLTFETHMTKLESKISPAVGALWKLRHTIPQKYKLSIFNSLVMSHLLYLVGCWATATDKAINQVQMMQNRAVRNVFNLDWRANRADMYRTHEILPIRGLCFHRTASFVHAILHGYRQFHLTIDFPSPKRGGTFISPTDAKNNYGEKALTRLGINMFNSLPESIKLIEQPGEFSSDVKAFIFKTKLIHKFFSPYNNFFELFKRFSTKLSS